MIRRIALAAALLLTAWPLAATARQPAPQSVTVSPWVTKSGTLIVFGASQGTTPAPIAAVSGAPTVYRNGKAIALGAPVGTQGTSKEVPFVAYRANCGSVRTIAVAAGGSGHKAPVRVLWNRDGGGSSLVLGTCTLTNGAVTWVPVLSSSDDFTGPPTFTMGDAGTGAVAPVLYPIMTGIAPGDVVTYDAPANWISPTLGGSANGYGNWVGGTVAPVAAVTAAPVDNWAGRLEGASGPFACFAQTPRLIPGVNVGSQPSDPGSLTTTAKNRARVGQWQIDGGVLATDAGGTPTTWTNPAAAVVHQWVHGPLGTGPLGDPWPAIPGRWTVRYDDPGAGTPMAAQVSLNSRYGATLISTARSGRITTATYNLAYPAAPATWELDASVRVRMPAGPDGRGHWTISGLKVVPPDARDGSAQPIGDGEPDHEPDPNAIRALAHVGATRWMDATAGYGGSPSAILPGDLVAPDAGSWRAGRTTRAVFVAARFYNTNPADPTYGWSSPTIQGPQALFGPNGLAMPPSDCGASFGGGQGIVIELRSAAPHPFRTGDWVGFDAGQGKIGVPIAGTAATFIPSNQGGMAFVTSPTTIAIVGYNPANATKDGRPQRVGSTAEIDLTAGGTRPGWSAWRAYPGASVPDRYAATFASRLPGSALWHNIGVMEADATIAARAAEVAKALDPSNRVLLEYSNECWNGGGPQTSQLGNLAGLLGTIPKGATVLDRYVSTGSAPAPYGAYVAMAGHDYGAFTSAAQAAGIDPSRIETVYGSFWVGYGITQQIVSAANTTGWRVDHVAVAPYLDTPADPSIIAAFSPAGAPGAEAWPCDAINDFVRHWGAYSAVQQSRWRGHARAIAASKQTRKPDIICYEGGFQTVIPWQVPGHKALWVDCLAHPSARDLAYGWFALCQQGDPTTPGSGASLACYYQAFCPTPIWSLAQGVGQVAGPGTSNKYATYQGGFPADGHEHAGGPAGNVSPLLQGLQDWGAAVAGPTPAPSG